MYHSLQSYDGCRCEILLTITSSWCLQVPKAPTPMQFSGLAQGGQVRPGFSPAMSDSSQQSDQKPMTKYAKAKLRKEQRKAEEEERMRKMQEDDRLRRQQQGGASVAHPHAQTPTQVAQSLSMPAAVPQPHPKLLESKQQGVQTIPAIKQEPQVDQHAGAASQRVPVAPTLLGQVVALTSNYTILLAFTLYIQLMRSFCMLVWLLYFYYDFSCTSLFITIYRWEDGAQLKAISSCVPSCVLLKASSHEIA